MQNTNAVYLVGVGALVALIVFIIWYNMAGPGSKGGNAKSMRKMGSAAAAAPSSSSSNGCGSGSCDPQTGFSNVPGYGNLVPSPQLCYFGDKDSRYENLGSYVPAAKYTSGCISEGCSNDLSARSLCNKIDKPGSANGFCAEAYGLSSADMMFAGPSEGCSQYCNMDLSRYDPCNIGMVTCDPCKINDSCQPFDDTVIDEPRDLAYLDGIRADGLTFLTTNFNQSTDLRGDLPVGLPQCAVHNDPSQCSDCCIAPAGASLSTHGVFLETVPLRTYTY